VAQSVSLLIKPRSLPLAILKRGLDNPIVRDN
jgi:hypothetical protein